MAYVHIIFNRAGFTPCLVSQENQFVVYVPGNSLKANGKCALRALRLINDLFEVTVFWKFARIYCGSESINSNYGLSSYLCQI